MNGQAPSGLPAIQVQSKAPKSETSAYGPGGRLLQKGNLAFEYDAKGRRTAKTKTLDDGAVLRTEYGWDGRDRLRSIKKPDGTILRYAYDAFGRRGSKTEGARTFVHEPGTFEPFLQEQAGRVYSPFRLLGQVQDDDAELTWTRFRCFDPEIGQLARHKVTIDGQVFDLKNHPHEHQMRTLEGPKGPYQKKQVRILDQYGSPLTGWVNEK